MALQQRNTDAKAKKLYDSAAEWFELCVAEGGANIHAGIRAFPEQPMKDAYENTIAVLMKLATSCGVKFGPGQCMVDLGAGYGGAAHKIATETGTHVTCLNLSEVQNQCNEKICVERGLSDRVRVVTGSFESLPEDWNSCFDIVWSNDAICYSKRKSCVFSESFRALKSGGALVMTDIMADESATEETLKPYITRTKVEELQTLQQYKQILSSIGLDVVRTECFTTHLIPYMQHVIEKSNQERDKLAPSAQDFVNQCIEQMKHSISAVSKGEGHAWYGLVARKP